MARMEDKETKELLIEIRDELKKINKILEKQEEEETYTCDFCDEEEEGEPYKKVNKYQFCSQNCWDEWKEESE